MSNNILSEEYIYVIEPNNLHYQDGHRKIKIGYTTNLKSRLSSYNTASPDGITIHGTFRIHQAIEIEKHLHNMYASKATNGNNREWFNLTQLDLINILNYLSIVENADRVRLGILFNINNNNTDNASMEIFTNTEEFNLPTKLVDNEPTIMDLFIKFSQ